VTEKRVWRIAVIPGDGIGTEVVREGQRVLDALRRTRAASSPSSGSRSPGVLSPSLSPPRLSMLASPMT
jgi:hypothetical protein